MPRPTQPTLAGEREADLCVVGLGGSGLAAVLAGLRAGMDVIGIDAGRVGSGAAGRNGGFLLAGPAHFHHQARAQFGTEAAVAMYRATAQEITQFVVHDPVARRTGSLRIGADDEELEDIEQHFQALTEDGFPAERYQGPEGSGLLVPSDGVFDPVEWSGRLAVAACEEGAALFEDSPATEITSGGVSTPSGSVRCRHVIVAVDGGLETLFPALSPRVATWRLQMLATLPVGRSVTRHAVYHRRGLDYWQQLPDGRIALGGGRDIGGEDERGAALGTTQAVQDYLESLLRHHLDVEAPVEHRWSGRVAFTNDHLPICEEMRPGIFAIGAYSGTGNVIGAICGREAVAQINGKPAPFIAAVARARRDMSAQGEP